MATMSRLEVVPIQSTQLPSAAPVQRASTIAIKLPEPKRFDGSPGKIEGWIYGLELYFQACGLLPNGNDASRCAAITASLLEGTAQTWHRRLSLADTLPATYLDLKKEMLLQFGFIDEARRARDRLKTLRQISNVMSYVKEFEKIVLYLPSATQEEILHAFTFGLKPEIKT